MKRWNTRKYILKTNNISVLLLTLLPCTYYNQEEWARTTSCSEWASTETENPAEHLSVQAWSVESIMFWMLMTTGMIACTGIEFRDKSTRWIYKISFSDGEMQAVHHNPEFHFSILNCIMSLITNHVWIHFSKCSESYI